MNLPSCIHRPCVFAICYFCSTLKYLSVDGRQRRQRCRCHGVGREKEGPLPARGKRDDANREKFKFPVGGVVGRREGGRETATFPNGLVVLQNSGEWK